MCHVLKHSVNDVIMSMQRPGLHLLRILLVETSRHVLLSPAYYFFHGTILRPLRDHLGWQASRCYHNGWHGEVCVPRVCFHSIEYSVEEKAMLAADKRKSDVYLSLLLKEHHFQRREVRNHAKFDSSTPKSPVSIKWDRLYSYREHKANQCKKKKVWLF